MLSFSSSLVFSLPTSIAPNEVINSNKKNSMRRAMCCTKPSWVFPQMLPTSLSPSRLLEISLPLAASLSIVLWSNPAHAGFMSGSTGLESIPGPQLPQIDFLNKWNETYQKKYAEFDARFKSTTVLKELLEKSKLNAERNKKEIQDKYCLRGAEWGVGDCSTQGMTDEEKDAFIAMLKKKAGE